MNDFLAMLHPPGWSIWQTIGTGAVLTIGYAVGKAVIDGFFTVLAKARK